MSEKSIRTIWWIFFRKIEFFEKKFVKKRVFSSYRLFIITRFLQNGVLPTGAWKFKIDTSRCHTMIIFEINQLEWLGNTFPNFVQHMLTYCWPRLWYVKIPLKCSKMQMFTKCMGSSSVGGSRIWGWLQIKSIEMFFDTQNIFDQYLWRFGGYFNMTFIEYRVFAGIHNVF